MSPTKGQSATATRRSAPRTSMGALRAGDGVINAQASVKPISAHGSYHLGIATPTVSTSVAAPGMSGTPVADGPPKYNPKLDSVPLDRLQAMLSKNKDDKIALLEKRVMLAGAEDDFDLMAEDPEILDGNIKLLTKRIEELKAAIANRPDAPSSSGSRAGTPSQAAQSYPTPSSVPAPRTIPRHIPPPLLDATSHTSTSRFFAQSPQRQRPPPLVPESPSPDVDETDIAAAEEWDDASEELVPPSSPPPAPLALQSSPPPVPQTPPRPKSVPLKRVDASSAMAEFEDISVEQLFSSPPPVRVTPKRAPPRTEASSARSDIGGPGPSTAASISRMTSTGQTPVAVRVSHPWTKEVEQKLRQVFKLPRFRTHQKETIDETMAGRDVFVLMPTGGGKSLTYQLPAICSSGKTKGVTFVVSPLISLITDQTRHLIKRGIPAIAYTGDLTVRDKQMAHEELSRIDPCTKVVYVTPEMLNMGGTIKSILRNLIRRNRLARFVIDEAHCVSAWGHDFRSDYLKLGNLRKEYPSVPIMALTATAPNKVQEDIINVLGIRGCTVLKQSFNRPNLHYEVRPKLKKVLHDIAGFIGTQQPGASGIIYCASREKCEVLAKELRDKHNVQAWHYHAGMPKSDRRMVQEGWQDHKFEVIVATVAFGMGIDKPDVRYVIHHSLPRSLEGYYQETGRAGRDGKNSTCILFYSYADTKSVYQMIDREANLTREQKERQKDNMREVLRFCTNKTDCRRSQVLAFFNEVFDASNCHQGCDVCLGRDQNQFTIKDVSEDAKEAIEMIKAFGSGDNITIINAVDCFRGVLGGSGKGLDSNPKFGCGKDWDRVEAERLITNLLIEGGLDEYYQANAGGWSNAYLRLGPEYRSFLSGRKKLQMDFRHASPRKPRKSTSAKAAPKRGRDAPQTTLSMGEPSNPLARKRSRQQIAEEEQAFDDSPWGDSEDEQVPVPPRDSGNKKRRTAAATAAVAAPVVSDRTATSAQQCLADLRKLRDKKTGPRLGDEVLELIAAMMPPNLKALEQVEGMTPALLQAFSTKILGITTKYVRQARAEEAPASSSSALTRKLENAARAGGGSTGSVRLTDLSSYYRYGAAPSNSVKEKSGGAAIVGGRVALARKTSTAAPRF